jgi:hypothetical protein
MYYFSNAQYNTIEAATTCEMEKKLKFRLPQEKIRFQLLLKIVFKS